MQKIKRIIPKDEIFENEYYEDLIEFLDLCGINAIFIEDDNGTWRFRENPIISYLREFHSDETWKTHGTNRGLNLIAEKASEENYTLRDFVELYIHIGYSLCGFLEIFGECIDQVLRINYDKEGNFIEKLGPDTESISHIDKARYGAKS